MKQEQLKKLADWYYGKDLWKTEYKQIPFIPHKDSNQLDMLGDKLWEDFNVEYMKIKNTPTAFIADYYKKYKTYSLFKKSVPSERIISGRGKTKNEARLNAILNYVEK